MVRAAVVPFDIIIKLERIENCISAIDYNSVLTRSSPNKVQVCWMILASHFSFGSGGGVPAIGCGLGRVVVPVLLDLLEVLGAANNNKLMEISIIFNVKQ